MYIYCLGDSLTFGYGVSRRENWVSLLAEMTGYTVRNVGINGDTTAGMLARFCVEPREPKPDVALFMGGCNDIFLTGTDSNARCNMGALIQQSLSRAVIPMIGLPVPYPSRKVREDWSALTDFVSAGEVLRGYTQWLRRYSRVFGVPIVDFWSVFEAFPESTRQTLFIDGLHPTTEGHQLMAKTAFEALKLLISQNAFSSRS